MLESCSDPAGPSGGRAVGAGTLGSRLARSALFGDAGKAFPKCALRLARGLLAGRRADPVVRV